MGRNVEALGGVKMLLKVMKELFEIAIQGKKDAEEELEKKNDCGINEYEKLLQKLEAEVRQHIRIEQQLKLYAESTQ